VHLRGNGLGGMICSINKQGIVPIQRVAGDNIVICEALKGNMTK